MDNQDQNTERPHRTSMRRARTAGFSAGGRRGDSMGAPRMPQERDEVEDVIDLNQSVRALPPPTMAPPRGTMPTADGGSDDENTPGSRLFSVQRAGSAAYAKEFRLGLMAKMLMRGVGLDVIAQQLRVSIHTAEKYRAELKERFREDARTININEMIGSTSSVYDEISQMSMRIASAGQGSGAVPIPMRLAAMRTTLAAQADKTRFLSSTGVFDAMHYRQSDSSGDISDVQLLMQQTQQALQAIMQDDDQEDEEAPPPPRVARKRTRKESFGPMTFDDRNSSGSDAEVVEL